MAKYLFVYYGGKMVTDPKEREKMMAGWMKWFGDMGKAVVDAGAPTQAAKTVSSKGVKDIGANPVGGYSVIQADNLDAAIAFAKKCPIVAEGGDVAIYTIMPM
jgi:hypothetical protein